MIPLALHMIPEGAYTDTPNAEHGHITDMTVLPNGTYSGKPSVALRVRLDNGTVAIVETTWALMHSAVHAFESKYGEPM